MGDDKEKRHGEETFEEIQRIRMTLKGREVKALEHACSEIVSRSKNKGYEIKGPVRIPTKILRVTVRKSPCGEGTNTWDRYEMKSIRESSTSTAHPPLSRTSPPSRLTPPLMLTLSSSDNEQIQIPDEWKSVYTSQSILK